VLTRTEDKALALDKARDLPARSAMATTVGADLFVSIHFNSLSPNEAPSGTEIYAFTPAGQRSTNSWSSPTDDDTVPAAKPVNRHDPWSALLAHELQQQLVSSLKTRDRGQKTSHLVVLRDLDCPGVLIESAFLSNPAEARKVGTPEFRDQIAAAIVAGIEAYAKNIRAARAAQ
jgi:N-acetylmuramoyl-L-alanine amidase